MVLVINTRETNASDRIKIYVNNVLQERAGSNLALNYETAVNRITHTIGSYRNGANYFDGMLADIQMVDAQALSPDAFGYLDDDGVWQPKVAEVGERTPPADYQRNYCRNQQLYATVAWPGYAERNWASTDTWNNMPAASNFNNFG